MHSCSKLEEEICVRVDFYSIHRPYFIYVHKIFLRTQVKIKQQWKSTFGYMDWATTSRTEGVEACICLCKSSIK